MILLVPALPCKRHDALHWVCWIVVALEMIHASLTLSSNAKAAINIREEGGGCTYESSQLRVGLNSGIAPLGFWHRDGSLHMRAGECNEV